MKKRSLVLVATLSLALSAAPAGAGSRRNDFQAECSSTTATVPITREQAEQHLPPGFESGVGSADQKEVPYVYLMSAVCGKDPAAPTLRMSIAYLLTQPPERHEMAGLDARFVLAAATGGPEARIVERRLCLGDLFSEGDINQVVHVGSSNTGDGAFAASVASEDLSASWEVVTTQIMNSQSGGSRWFFRGQEGIEYFDSASFSDAVALGVGEVRFSEPFFDLPAVGTGPALFRHAVMYFPPRKCAA